MGGLPDLADTGEQGPKLQVHEAWLALLRAGVAVQPLPELIRRAGSKETLPPCMGLQAFRP